jgi:hypothetical protein
MLNFFRKDKSFPLPEAYSGIVNQEEYSAIVGLCKNYLNNVGQQLLRIGEGEIVVAAGEDEKHYFLDNLVRVLAQSERDEWEKLVNEHFDKNQEVPHALEYLYKDFEYAAQFVKAYIKPYDFFPEDQVKLHVHRIDLPQTITFLILDFNEQFHFVRREHIQEWNKSEEELFEIGLANIAAESIEIQEALFQEKYTVFSFFSGDFSSSFIIELERNASFAIGSYGSVVAIPTKGSAFVHPIESTDVMDLIGMLAGITQNFFNEDPGSITMNFYWFHDGVFELFPTEPGEEEGYVTIKWPRGLKDRFGVG